MDKGVPPYRYHLQRSENLVTTPEATRAGFIALALEKNRLATPYANEARALQEAISEAKTPADVLNNKKIEAALLAAAGLSENPLFIYQRKIKKKLSIGSSRISWNRREKNLLRS
jgi:hypothetical protein